MSRDFAVNRAVGQTCRIVPKAMRGLIAFRKHFVRKCMEESALFRGSFGSAHASSRRFTLGRRFLTLDRLSRPGLQAGSRLSLQSIAPVSRQTWRFQSQTFQPYAVRR
jgi:hypothetical protein